MLSKLSNLNSNLAPTLGYVNPALNNSALGDNEVPRYECLPVTQTTWLNISNKNM